MRLALRAEVSRRRVETLQRLVRARPDRDFGFQHERVGGIADGQRLAGDLDAVSRDRLTVDAHRAGVESTSGEDQVRGRWRIGVSPDLEPGPHHGPSRVQVEVEVHLVDEERRRGVVRESRDGGFGGVFGVH